MRLEDYEYVESMIEILKNIGEIVLEDDAPDIGKFDRIHHWHIGAALIALAEIGNMISTIKSMTDEESLEDLRRIIEVRMNEAD